jgi:hypothetical protein
MSKITADQIGDGFTVKGAILKTWRQGAVNEDHLGLQFLNKTENVLTIQNTKIISAFVYWS